MLDKSPADWSTSEKLTMGYVLGGLSIWIVLFSMFYALGVVGMISAALALTYGGIIAFALTRKGSKLASWGPHAAVDKKDDS